MTEPNEQAPTPGSTSTTAPKSAATPKPAAASAAIPKSFATSAIPVLKETVGGIAHAAHKEPTAAHKAPAAPYKEPAAANRESAAANKEPAAAQRTPAPTSNELPVVKEPQAAKNSATTPKPANNSASRKATSTPKSSTPKPSTTLRTITSKQDQIRQDLAIWIESQKVQNVIIGLIIVNAIALGLETSPELAARWSSAFNWLEIIILTLFSIEILLKLYCFEVRFFKSGWNLMDFFVVGVSLVPAAGSFAVLRSLRILRVLRLLSTVPRLRHLTESLFSALPSIGWITFMLGLVFYVFGVLGTELFGSRFPEWFGSLGASIYSLFQVMTLESWSMGIARPVMEVYSWAWMFFVPFILISSFTILNLFIGIIVNSMQAMHWEEEEEKRLETELVAQAEREEMLALIRATANSVKALEAKLDKH